MTTERFQQAVFGCMTTKNDMMVLNNGTTTKEPEMREHGLDYRLFHRLTAKRVHLVKRNLNTIARERIA